MGDDRIPKALVCLISHFSLYIFCVPVDHTCFSFAVSGVF